MIDPSQDHRSAHPRATDPFVGATRRCRRALCAAHTPPRRPRNSTVSEHRDGDGDDQRGVTDGHDHHSVFRPVHCGAAIGERGAQDGTARDQDIHLCDTLSCQIRRSSVESRVADGAAAYRRLWPKPPPPHCPSQSFLRERDRLSSRLIQILVRTTQGFVGVTRVSQVGTDGGGPRRTSMDECAAQAGSSKSR